MENLLKLLEIEYNNKVGDFEFINSKMSLTEIAVKLKRDPKKIKCEYVKGLKFLRDLITAYHLIVEFEDKDLVTPEAEEFFNKNVNKIKKIPYIGIDEFSVLFHKNKKLLENILKNL